MPELGPNLMGQGLNVAAFTIDHKCISQPSRNIHKTAARTNWKIAIINLPCSSCPNPGIKKLHNAASTLPPDPCPELIKTELSPKKRIAIGNCLALGLAFQSFDQMLSPNFGNAPRRDLGAKAFRFWEAPRLSGSPAQSIIAEDLFSI